MCHSATVFSNSLMHCGTTVDAFLRDNLDWLKKATNWAKFSATAGAPAAAFVCGRSACAGRAAPRLRATTACMRPVAAAAGGWRRPNCGPVSCSSTLGFCEPHSLPTVSVVSTVSVVAVCGRAGLGVIHRGNVGKSLTIMAPYLPSAPGGSTPSPYSGALASLSGSATA